MRAAVIDVQTLKFDEKGLIPAIVQDAETGRKMWIDTSLAALRDHYRGEWERLSRETASVLNRSRVDNVSVATDEDYVKALIKLFNRR